jgi:CDP-diglyceride synthetase
VSNWPIILVCALAILYGMVHAVLMLVSPAKHRRFNLRVNDPFGRLKLRPPDRGTDHGLELEYRLVGLAGILVCILIAWGSLDSLLGHHYGESLPKHAATPTIAIGKTWWGFVAATGCLAFGLYASLRPFGVYRWTTGRLLPSGVAPPEPNQIRRGMRFLGTCFMALGVILFWLAFKQN